MVSKSNRAERHDFELMTTREIVNCFSLVARLSFNASFSLTPVWEFFFLLNARSAAQTFSKQWSESAKMSFLIEPIEGECD